MTQLIPAITSAYSLFSGIGQQAAARRQMQQALAQERKGARIFADDYERIQKEVQAQRAAGVGDPTQAIQQLQEMMNTGQRLATGNAARAFRTAGGRAGDTSLEDAIRNVSERGQQAYNAQALQVKQNALQDSLRLSQLLSQGAAQWGKAEASLAPGLRFAAQANPGDVASPLQALGSIDWDSIFKPKRQPQPNVR